MNNNHLVSGLKEVYKFAELIFTIPCSISSMEYSFSALKHIHTLPILSSLGLISIEKGLLEVFD